MPPGIGIGLRFIGSKVQDYAGGRPRVEAESQTLHPQIQPIHREAAEFVIGRRIAIPAENGNMRADGLIDTGAAGIEARRAYAAADPCAHPAGKLATRGLREKREHWLRPRR